MNARYMIDALFHTVIYCHMPLLLIQENQKLFFVRFLDEPARLGYRYIINASIGFLAFLYFQMSGMRNRYIIWHMARNNILSGFHALEILGVGLYFSFILCLPTEVALEVFVPSTNPLLTDLVWYRQTVVRMNLLFLVSVAFHILYEKFGLGPFLRANYFQREFLLGD